jgi:hypothetical protein
MCGTTSQDKRKGGQAIQMATCQLLGGCVLFLACPLVQCPHSMSPSGHGRENLVPCDKEKEDREPMGPGLSLLSASPGSEAMGNGLSLHIQDGESLCMICVPMPDMCQRLQPTCLAELDPGEPELRLSPPSNHRVLVYVGGVGEPWKIRLLCLAMAGYLESLCEPHCEG